MRDRRARGKRRFEILAVEFIVAREDRRGRGRSCASAPHVARSLPADSRTLAHVLDRAAKLALKRVAARSAPVESTEAWPETRIRSPTRVGRAERAGARSGVFWHRGDIG